jgi:4'-phosphopantetheinyl transferase
VVALSAAGPVGVDLEAMRPHPEAVARRWFSPKEYRWFDSFSTSSMRDDAFFQVFTMREAFAKAWGLPLWRTPEVPVAVSEPAPLDTGSGRVTWGPLRVLPGAAASLCVRTGSEFAIDVVRIDARDALAA